MRRLRAVQRQGDRTYLPMPFAHVVGGGWLGVPRDTSAGSGTTSVSGSRTSCGRSGGRPGRPGAAAPRSARANRPLCCGLPRPDRAAASCRRMGLSAVDQRQRVEHPGARAARRSSAASPRTCRWVSSSSRRGATRRRCGVPRRALRGARRRFAAPAGDFEFPADGAWPDPKGMVDSCTTGRSGRAVADPADPRPTRGRRGQGAPTRRRMVERGLRRPRGGRSPVPEPWLVVPGRAAARLHQPGGEARGGLAKRRYLLDEVGIDGFKTDGGEHAWGARPALRRRHARRRGRTTGTRCCTRRRTTSCCGDRRRRHDASAAPGFTGAGGFPAHWAGDERSTWEAYRASIIAGLTAGASAGSSSGAGTSGASPARSPTPSCTCAPAAMAASARSCSTTRSSTTTAARRATARRGTSPSGPATTGR